ncbi:MAG: hypothetical protein KIS73_10560 [Enhydrobacter sp.]|nr:hypothetical protein [Enhydrobacter sp.]
MFILAFDRRHKILRSTVVGVLSSNLLSAWDQAVVAFTAAHGPSHGLIDFTEVAAIAVPLSRLASRGRQPQISPGWERVIVAPRTDLVEWSRIFSEYQGAAGFRPPITVASMDEAYRLLGLTDPIFEPVQDVGPTGGPYGI